MKIESIEQLRELASQPDGCDCHIRLGICSSSKHIVYEDGYGWDVYHLIDDTESLCKDDKSLEAETNIVEAINKGSLFTDY